jgi:hypothetical protein
LAFLAGWFRAGFATEQPSREFASRRDGVTRDTQHFNSPGSA